MLRRIAAFVLISIAASACGSRPMIVGGASADAAVPGQTAVMSSPENPIGSVASGFPTTTPRPAAARRGSGEGGITGFTPGAGANNTMPLQVRLSRACVQPGQEMQATAITLPASKLAFAAAYSDNDIVPDFTYTPAEANPTGTFTWSWVIRPTIPPGDAIVSVVAAKDKRGASFEAPFRVARAC